MVEQPFLELFFLKKPIEKPAKTVPSPDRSGTTPLRGTAYGGCSAGKGLRSFAPKNKKTKV